MRLVAAAQLRAIVWFTCINILQFSASWACVCVRVCVSIDGHGPLAPRVGAYHCPAF